MADVTFKDRLQPALLDRLTDDQPEEKQEARESRPITRSKLRQAVVRDLTWLFNATQLGNSADFSGLPQARCSVLNFGLPALSGETASSLDILDLERNVRQAILQFEPRILPSTLEVQAIATESALDQHNIVSVEIRGALWAQPMPLEMLLRTDVDLETGKVEIKDLTA